MVTGVFLGYLIPGIPAALSSLQACRRVSTKLYDGALAFLFVVSKGRAATLKKKNYLAQAV